MALMYFRKGLRRCGDDEAGLSMVEMIVALVVFGLMSLAVASTLIQTIATSRTNRQRVQAAGVAESLMDATRNLPTAAIPQGQSMTTRTVGTTAYSIVQNAVYTQDPTTPSNQSTCDSSSNGGLAYVRITEVVSWANMGNQKPVRADTVRAVNINGLDPNKGALSVKVLNDRFPNGVAGVPVTVGSQTQTTGEDGCVVFPALAVGTVGLSIATPGWVTPTGGPTISATPSISAGLLTRAQFAYDIAGAVTLTPSPAGAKIPSGLLNTLSNPNYTGGYTSANCLTGSGCAALYPSASGYRIWAGDCTAASPANAGGTLPAAVTIIPAGVASAAVPVDTVTVTSTSASPQALTVTAQSGDAGCPTPDTFTLGSLSSAAPVMVALPFGTWVFSKPANTGNSTVTINCVLTTSTTTKTCGFTS